MAAPGIVAVMTMTYRDAPEEWSQKYHFQGDAPSDPAGWRSLCDDFVALLAPALASRVTILRFQCYEDTDDTSVYTYNLAAFAGTVAGTYTLVADCQGYAQGDDAALVRWNTGRVSSRGKPVYLFKYFHSPAQSSGDVDKPSDSYKARLATFAAAVEAVSGDWPGIADKTGTAPVGQLAESYLTTRTLKRRGRRPS
jgi:hypothetical protein